MLNAEYQGNEGFLQRDIFKSGKMDLEILSFNAWKGKRIGRVLPPYITKIQQKCAVNMVREGVAPLPKELFISFED